MTDTTQAKGAAHLTDENFEETIKNAGKPVMVDFFATWCGPCKMAAPVIEKLADEYRDKIMVVKLDTDENPDSASKHGIMSIPTVMIFKAENGEIKVLDRKIGFPGEEGYRQMIRKVIGE